jgi:hypothetical protein
MLRSSLFLLGILIAGAATAQETRDPAAAAAVVYDAPSAGCDSGTAAAMPCTASDEGDDDAADVAADVAVDAQDDEYIEDAPVYGDTTDYYPGVSLLPDYWVPGFGFGWPYYAYAPFAYGWPYYGFGFASWGWGWGWPAYGFAWNWGGHHHHGDHHHGGHDHHGYASHAYPGPYRYLGHGRYLNHAHTASGERAMVHADRAASRTLSPASQRVSTAHTAALAARRAVLPSASYYAMARRGEVAPRAIASARPGVWASRPVTAANREGSGRYNRADHAVATRADARRYAAMSLPSRAYAPSNRSARVASGSYAAPYSRGARSYSPTRYAGANRGYAGASRAPSYYRAPGFAAQSAPRSPTMHGGSGSPAPVSAGSTRGGSSVPHRH